MAAVTIYDEKFHTLVQSRPRILEYAQDPSETPASPGIHEGCNCERCNARLNRPRVINEDDDGDEEKRDETKLPKAEPTTEKVHVDNYTVYLGQMRGKVHIASSEGPIILMHRCLLAGKKQEIVNLKQSLFSLKHPRWCLLMLGGGHFAAGIFDGSRLLQNKTFHTYTVRAGQGGSQSSKDNKNRSAAPKSAGATLRRANEQALVQEVTSVLHSWKEELQTCTAIFLRAPGPYNKNMLFGGKNPPLQRDDPRLRVVPFVTGRSTLKELKRIQEVLASVTIYESLDTIPVKQASPDDNEVKRRSKTKEGSMNRAKSRESVERPLPVPLDEDSDQNESDSGSSDPDDLEDSFSDDDEISNSLEDLQISFEQSLNYPESPIIDKPAPQKKPQNEKTRKHQERQAQIREAAARAKEEQKLAIRVEQAIENSSLDEFIELLQTHPAFIDLVINNDEDTPLHVCAKREKTELLGFLLENGADVCAKNVKHQTPYTCTPNKSMREIFKKFAQENPDKYNYPKAQIPVVQKLTEEQLEAKNKRAKEQKKAKRDRYKENKKVKQEEQEEQQERERFAQLSDREKRALAAERRILDAKGTVTSRCFLCGNDMGGKAGFEYSNNKFCTLECLKAHRMKNPVVLS